MTPRNSEEAGPRLGRLEPMCFFQGVYICVFFRVAKGIIIICGSLEKDNPIQLAHSG